jgi:hypothetical protein
VIILLRVHTSEGEIMGKRAFEFKEERGLILWLLMYVGAYSKETMNTVSCERNVALQNFVVNTCI